MINWGRHRTAEHPDGHDGARERAPRPIWLPQLAEPVTLLLDSGEKLPGRVTERSADSLVVAVIVPAGTIGEARLRSLVLEYANPGGRVRLSGEVRMERSAEGMLVRIEEPRLLEVRQERAHVRALAECPIVLRSSPEAEPLHAHTEDVSAGGVLLGAPEALGLGERLQVHLTIDPAEPAVECAGEVVRFDALGRAGIQFSELSTYDLWRLIHFTVECQSREGFRHTDEAQEGRHADPAI